MLNEAITHRPLNCFTTLISYSFVWVLCKYDDLVFQNNILKMHTIMIQYVKCKINKNMYNFKKHILQNILLHGVLLKKPKEQVDIF